MNKIRWSVNKYIKPMVNSRVVCLRRMDLSGWECSGSEFSRELGRRLKRKEVG